jgi:hypothetical protein
LIIFAAAVLVSVLAAGSMIGFAALMGSLAWVVIGGVLTAVLGSWLFGFVIWRHDREALRRLVLAHSSSSVARSC